MTPRTPIQYLRTPSGRIFQLWIARDGTRAIGAHFHKRELLSIVNSLNASVERMKQHGFTEEQREYEELRDLYLKALEHDA